MKNPLRIRRSILSAALMVFGLTSFAENPKVSLSVPGADKGVVLESVRIDVDILGNYAMTTSELVFHNPNGTILEGSLEFPLLEGQSVVRFAMDVSGELREAVPVEKERGQEVFEAIERRGVDPGLLERTEGNHYRARIYPIPANGSKRVIIGTLEDLSTQGNRPVFRLPLNHGTVKSFSVRIQVRGSDSIPGVHVTGNDLVFSDWRQDWVSEAAATNFKADGTVEVELPQASKPHAFTGQANGKTYFYVPLTIPSHSPSKRPAPSTISLVWDASGSAQQRDFDREFAFLESLFATYPNVDVKLHFLRNSIEDAGTLSIRKGDWSGLRNTLKSAARDGATCWDALASAFTGDWCIVFSDGMKNWGSNDPLTSSVPVFCVTSTAQSDTSRMRDLSERSGGAFVNLLSDSPDKAIQQLTDAPSIIESIDYNPQDLAFVTPAAGARLNQGAAVTGILRANQASIQLVIRTGDGKSHSHLIPVSSNTPASPLVPRVWAASRIRSLETDFERNRAEIEQLGKDFNIVTQGTSLIILDTIEDYVTYRIRPPASMLSEYENRIRQLDQNKHADQERHLDDVLRLFQSRIKWYEKKFPKDDPKMEPEKEKKERALTAGATPPAPMGATFSASVPEEVQVRETSIMFSAEGEAQERLASDEMHDYGEPGGLGDGPDGAASTAPGNTATIALQPWKPDSSYAAHLNRMDGEDCYRAYLEEKPDYLRSTAFYLDCFDILMDKNLPDLALRVLSNLAEIQIENHSILRILGYRLVQAGHPELAIPVFEKVASIRPEEPQSFRDLALTWQTIGDHRKAIDLFWKVISSSWDGRFPEIELIALNDLNALISSAPSGLDLSAIDARFIRPMPLDLRVVLTWDADNTDIDLWVTDPNGETCKYDHNLTYQGGLISRDFTRGYGPEEFVLRMAKPGTYRIQANYYGNTQQIISGSTTLQLAFQTGFGTPEFEEKSVTLRLKDIKEVIHVGSFVVE